MFGFDYHLECYVPAPLRKHGYYVLPILRRGRLVGRLDAKAHRAEGIFEVKALYLEPAVRTSDALLRDVSMSPARLPPARPGTARLRCASGGPCRPARAGAWRPRSARSGDDAQRGYPGLPRAPDDLLAKLATLVPPSRLHAVRYHGDKAAAS